MSKVVKIKPYSNICAKEQVSSAIVIVILANDHQLL